VKFCLGSDVIFICAQESQSKDYKFDVHRWCASAARFVRDTDTEDRLKVTSVYNAYIDVYVDDKYLIINFNYWVNGSRLIKVFCLETMQLLRERKFYSILSSRYKIWNEYHDGGIVVWTRQIGRRSSCVALWDVDKDTVQPITDHPNQFLHSFTMTHHPFQIVVQKEKKSTQLLLVQRGQPTGNSFIDMPSQLCVPNDLFYRNNLCFDGVQMIAQFYDQSKNEFKIMMADLVG